MRVELSSLTLVVGLFVASNVSAQGNPGALPPPPPSPTQVAPPVAPPSASPPAVPLPPPPAATNPPPDVAPPSPPAGTTLPTAPPAPPGTAPYPYPGVQQPYYPNGSYPYPQGAYHQGSAPAWPYALPTKTVKHWYGWQTLIGVVAGDVVALIGSGISLPMLYVGIGGHVLTGPIVHWAHGNVGKGFASLGLNVGLPGLGLAVGWGISNGPSNDVNWGRLLMFVLVGGIGYVAAPTLDMALLSTETVTQSTAPPKGARALLPSSVSVMPMLDQNRRGLMLVGQF